MRKTGLRGKYLYALPQVDWNNAIVRKKADAYLYHLVSNELLNRRVPHHPMSSSELKSLVILGIAVDRIVCVCGLEK
jgi:hypothetical protein